MHDTLATTMTSRRDSSAEVAAPNQVILTLQDPITVGIYYYCIIRNVQAQNGHFIADTAVTFVHGYSPNHTVFVGWTFDDITNPILSAHLPLAANYGVLHNYARLYYNGEYGASQFIWDTTSNFAYSELRNFVGNSGTVIGDPRPSSDASKCFAIQNTSANGKHFVLKFSTENYKNIILSYARRVTQTGFYKYFYEWSYDGEHYEPLTDTINIVNNTFIGEYQLYLLDLQEFDYLEQQADLFIRITIDSASSAFGNVRFDNICLHGQKCIADHIIVYDTIPQGGIYTGYGFNIPISSTQQLGTLEYERQVEVSGGCDTLYTLNLTIIVGTNDLDIPHFSIYPNPAREQITIFGENLSAFGIYNSVGQQLGQYDMEGNSRTISVNQLPAGIYFIKVQTFNGGNASRKIIIR